MATFQKILTLVVVVFGIIGLVSIFRTLYQLWNSYLPDFHVFYYSAFDVVHRINPYEDRKLYTGLGYPLNAVLFYIPFLIIPFTLASKIFLLINVLCLFLIVYISIKITKINESLKYFIFFASLAVLSFPFKFSFGMGQSNILAYTLLLFAFYLHLRKNDIKSGVLLGLSLLIKPIFIFMLIYFLLQKTYKTISIAGGVVVSFTAVSIFMLGPNPYEYYITSLVPHLFSLEGREVYYNQGITGFVSRLTDNHAFRRIFPMAVGLMLTFFTIFSVTRARISKKVLFSVVIIVLLLVDTLSWQHHFVFLIFPFIVAFWSINIRKRFHLLPFLLLSYLFISLNIRNPDQFSYFPYAFILSHVFYGTVILFVVLYKLALQKKVKR